MKLLAKRSFKNPQGQIVLEKPIHPNHVHKGAIFTVGAEENTPYEKLGREERYLVALLNDADCLGEATLENIAKVAVEIQTEEKSRAREAAALRK
jgi:hypothetical protein